MGAAEIEGKFSFASRDASPAAPPVINQKALGLDKMPVGKVMARVQLLPRPATVLHLQDTERLRPMDSLRLKIPTP